MSEPEALGCVHGLRVAADVAGEPEGERVPEGLRVFDAHVHLFPDRVFDAIWRWFDEHAWRVRYRLYAEQVVVHLVSRGVERLSALCYSHKPGMARVLNEFVAEVARAHPEVVPLGTVLPGEPDARAVLGDAFGRLGLRGIKLHCHVQGIAADDPRLEEVYAACEDAGRPVVIHAGRHPVLPGYAVDPRTICAVERVERVLERHPRLVLVVPHLGTDEFEGYERLLDRHENLWLDTTMVVGSYFEARPPPSLFPGRASRLLYGTDFPNVPYAWDRELRAIAAAGLDAAARDAILWGNARRVFGD